MYCSAVHAIKVIPVPVVCCIYCVDTYWYLHIDIFALFMEHTALLIHAGRRTVPCSCSGLYIQRDKAFPPLLVLLRLSWSAKAALSPDMKLHLKQKLQGSTWWWHDVGDGIENSSCRSHLRSVVAASLPPARPPVHEKAVWSQAAMASEA